MNGGGGQLSGDGGPGTGESAGGRPPDRKPPDGGSPDGRHPDGGSPDGRHPDGRPPDGGSGERPGGDRYENRRREFPTAGAGGEGLLLQAILKQVGDLGQRMERLQLAEYLALFENPRRFLWINFLTGVARGLGIAIGFTLLSALALYGLQRLMVLNLPVIGDFIAELVEIVQFRMKVTPGP